MDKKLLLVYKLDFKLVFNICYQSFNY